MLAGCEAATAAAVREAVAGSYILTAAAWLAVGRPDLAATSAATVIACYHDDSWAAAGTAAPTEVSLAYAQLATIAWERKGYECAFHPSLTQLASLQNGLQISQELKVHGGYEAGCSGV